MCFYLTLTVLLPVQIDKARTIEYIAVYILITKAVNVSANYNSYVLNFTSLPFTF